MALFGLIHLANYWRKWDKYNILKKDLLLTGSYLGIHTFRNFHGVHATQQVSDIKAVSLHLTQPVVTSKVEPQVRSDHIRHHHSVQEPAGVHAGVVMLNSEATEE